MKSYSIVLIALFFCCLTSCSDVEDNYVGNYKIETMLSDEEYKELENISGGKYDISNYSFDAKKEFSFLSLKDDGSFTLLYNKFFIYGEYLIQNNKLILKSHSDKENYVYTLSKKSKGIIQLKGDVLDVDRFSYDDDICYINISKIDVPITDINDVFSFEINKWRIQPDDHETYEELRERVVGNLSYISNYLRFHGEGPGSTINVESIRSPLRYARNGVMLNDYNDVSGYWIDLFYNEYDAKQAYDLIKQAFKEDIAMPSNTKNWAVLNSIIISQFKNKIKKM